MQSSLTEDRINDIEHQIFLVEKLDRNLRPVVNPTGKTNPQIVSQYEELMRIAEDEMQKTLLARFTENDSAVQDWQKKMVLLLRCYR